MVEDSVGALGRRCGYQRTDCERASLSERRRGKGRDDSSGGLLWQILVISFPFNLRIERFHLRFFSSLHWSCGKHMREDNRHERLSVVE